MRSPALSSATSRFSGPHSADRLQQEHIPNSFAEITTSINEFLSPVIAMLVSGHTQPDVLDSTRPLELKPHPHRPTDRTRGRPRGGPGSSPSRARDAISMLDAASGVKQRSRSSPTCCDGRSCRSRGRNANRDVGAGWRGRATRRSQFLDGVRSRGLWWGGLSPAPDARWACARITSERNHQSASCNANARRHGIPRHPASRVRKARSAFDPVRPLTRAYQ